MSPVEEFFADVALLSDLPAEAVSQVATHARERTFDPDDVILEMDAAADVFHVIRSGLAAVEIPSRSDQPLVIDTIGPGDMIGISWLFWMLVSIKWIRTGRRARSNSPTV